MGVVDIKCQDSFTSALNGCYPAKQRNVLFLGHEEQIYLFFNLPLCLPFGALSKARLRLFKLVCFPFPIHHTVDAENDSSRYALYPLLDFYSVFNCAFSTPAVDVDRRVDFTNCSHLSYTEIDITQIVEEWIRGKIENKGLLLTGSASSQCISYASGQYAVLGMRPTIRINLKENSICQPLKVVPCKVSVSGPASTKAE
ncbi:DNRLRE domain-containing protein [Ethanoligenens sp.]|uniref:DNRLRE domain-containing protein n=1 Tax=Ethanoligenens sp. TaxID=2099655 RepID=UPI0039E7BCA5